MVEPLVDSPPAVEENGAVRFRNTTTAQRLLALGAILFFLALRWNSYTIPFDRDEGEYAYSAWLMKHDVMPYENAFLQKPPLIIYTYLAAQLFSEESVVPPRVLATLALVLSIIITGIIVLRDFGAWAGITAMWWMAAMLTLRVLTPFAANTEVFLILPLVTLLLLYSWHRGRASGMIWFLGGICSALTLLFKPIALIVVVFIFTAWAIDAWREKHDAAALSRHAGSALLGGIFCSAVVLGPFIIHDYGRSFFECVVTFNIHYSQTNTFGLEPFFSFMGIFLESWWILFILLIGIFLTRPVRWLFYVALFGLSLLTIYNATSGHYYILAIPFWAIIASISLHAIVEKIEGMSRQVPGPIKITVVSLVVVLLILPHREQFTKSPAELTNWFYAQANPFTEARIVADKIRLASKENDLVFIAGSEPEILFYAKRRSPTRFVIMYPLMLSTPFAPAYQEEAKKSLQEHPPEYIVLATSRMSWLEQAESPKIFKEYLVRTLKEHYTIRGGIGREEKEWYPVMNEDIFNKCSLLVYQKISPREEGR